ncbi:MAG: cation:proton antiporter [Actinomycetota bacterium]|nr:cation:proton antiporter [Actinomycetota bacterium]
MDAPSLFLELGALLVVLAGAARLGERLGLSPIPLYLLVGLALGEGGLYPLVTAEGFIEAGAEIGVVLLLLLLGLEYSPGELLGGLRSNAAAAGLDLLLNFTPGMAAGLLLGWGVLGGAVLGGATYISSSGIAAKVVEDFGWLANREIPTVLSLLVAEDLVMAVYLPLVGALLVGGSPASVGVSAAVAMAAAGIVLLVALRYGSMVSRVVFSHSNEALLLGVLGLTLLVGGAAETLHVSAAVAAFLIGIAFSGPLQEGARGLLHPLRDLFAATFFVFFGLGIDPADIPAAAPAAALLALATAVTKAATAWWAGRRAGVASRGRWRAASVLMARGEFSIVVAELGVASNLHPSIGPVAATYVLLLAISGPLAARQFR